MMKQATKTQAKKRPLNYAAKKAQPEEDSPALLARHMGKSLLITVGVGILLTVICSLIAYFCADPDSMIRPLSFCAAALTALAGGFIAVRIHKHAALICGLLNGSLCTALMILASLFFRAYSSGYAAWLSCLLHIGFMLLSVAGAYIGLQHGTKSTKKMKRR